MMYCLGIQMGEETLEVPLTTDRDEATPDGCATVAVSIGGTDYYAYAVLGGGEMALASFQYEGQTYSLVKEHKQGGLIDGKWYIYTVSDLIAWKAYMESNSDYSIDALLCADIDMTGVNWESFNYDGTFDGQGHSIYGYKEEHEETWESWSGTYTKHIGFFATVDGTIKDLYFNGEVSFLLHGADDATNVSIYAGLLASNSGSYANLNIIGCHVSGSISIKADKIGGYQGLIGGVIGGIESIEGSRISDCSFDGTITLEQAYYADAGGIIGYARATAMSSCTNLGDVCIAANDASILSSTAIYAGGIAGHALINSSITECTHEGNVSADISEEISSTKYIGGIIGYQSTVSVSGCVNNGTPENDIGNA